MITKRTDELRPGDRVHTQNGDRVIQEVKQTERDPAWGDLLVKYVPRPELPGPWSAYVNAGDTWQVIEPSKLDLAVARAQELADYYDTEEGRDAVHSLRAKDLRELLDLFRAAR